MSEFEDNDDQKNAFVSSQFDSKFIQNNEEQIDEAFKQQLFAVVGVKTTEKDLTGKLEKSLPQLIAQSRGKRGHEGVYRILLDDSFVGIKSGTATLLADLIESRYPKRPKRPKRM